MTRGAVGFEALFPRRSAVGRSPVDPTLDHVLLLVEDDHLGSALAALFAHRMAPDANFSLREGLPAVQVLSPYQDRYGALWAGTTAGLAQLGGPSIRTFGPDEGLLRSAVFAIAEESSGAIVVGTAGGISRLTGGRFEPVSLPAVAAQLAVRRFARGQDGGLRALAGDRVLLRQIAD